MSSKRIDALTGVRALAVILVFVYHNRKYWQNEIPFELLRLINEFHVGVSLFFVLSGFLITFMYDDRPTSSYKSYFDYLAVRMARIFPLYWLILSCFYMDSRFGNYNFSLLTYTLTHGFSNQLNLSAISQSWSLCVEMCFYLAAPFMVLVMKKNKLMLLAGAGVLFVLFYFTGSLWQYVNGNPKQFFSPISFLLSSTFPGRALEFIFGMALALLLKSPRQSVLGLIPHKTIIGLVGIFVSIYIMGLFQDATYKHGFEHPVGRCISMLIAPAMITLFFAGLITEKTRIASFMGSKPMILLGNASFAFYLVHISYVNIKIRELWLGPDRNFIILWVVSLILYKFFENPIYNWVRKKIKWSAQETA